MNMKGINEIAKQRGIYPGKLGTIELVRTLQSGEGKCDCFAKAFDGYCDQSDCLWREDCLTLSTRRAKDS